MPDDSVFTTEIPATNQVTISSAPKSILSDADKVVGSKKPSLKSQSSVGSFSADPDVVEVKLQSENFQEPFTLANKPKEHKEVGKVFLYCSIMFMFWVRYIVTIC